MDPNSKYAAMQAPQHEFGSYLTSCLPKYVQQYSVLKDELTLYISPEGVIPVLTFLRDHTNCQYKACMDISGADYPSRTKRFEVVYHLLSVKHNSRIRVKTYADEVSPVPSATGLFRGADWWVGSDLRAWRSACIIGAESCVCGSCPCRPSAGTSERSGTCLVSSSPDTRICDAS